ELCPDGQRCRRRVAGHRGEPRLDQELPGGRGAHQELEDAAGTFAEPDEPPQRSRSDDAVGRPERSGFITCRCEKTRDGVGLPLTRRTSESAADLLRLIPGNERQEAPRVVIKGRVKRVL